MATKLNITRNQYENLRNQGLSKNEILGFGTKELKPTDFLDKTADVFDTIFGGGVIGEAIGTGLARSGLTGLTEEERQFVGEGPTKKQIAGDVLRTAALFTPVGRIGGATSRLARPLLGLGKIGKRTTSVGTGIRETTSRIAGISAGGGIAGAGFDVGEGLRRQEKPSFLATGLGIGLPPALKITSGIIRGTGFLASELAGVSTGAGGKTIQEFYKSIRAGGERAKQAARGIAGYVSEDVVVADATLALDKVVERRGINYVKKFKKVIDNKQQLNVQPIHNEVARMLKSFQIRKTATGGLDFSQSALRFNRQAQKEVKEIVDTMKIYGTQSGDRTPLGVDMLKQSLDDIFSESSKVKAFTAAVRASTRKVLENVKGYDKMSANYEKQTKFIKEVRNTFSLKDNTTKDAKLRKLLSSLRQQQGFKDELVKQLDEEAGTFITAQIAGQQLKEIMPMGILRAFGPTGAGLAGILGASVVGVLPMLQAIAIMSPRLIGEFVRVLGLTARQSDKFIKALNTTLPRGSGDILLKAAQSQIKG